MGFPRGQVGCVPVLCLFRICLRLTFSATTSLHLVCLCVTFPVDIFNVRAIAALVAASLLQDFGGFKVSSLAIFLSIFFLSGRTSFSMPLAPCDFALLS